MKYNEFFGSKLNTVLLLVLIVLMVFAIRIMLRNEDVYLHPFDQEQEQAITNKANDLVSFSITSGQKVSGIMKITGSVKNGYFFEGNILINVLDANKNVLKKSNAMATTDWMTSGPVSFEGNIDFSGLQKGPAYIEVHNDNPSDIRVNDKSILVPIVVE